MKKVRKAVIPAAGLGTRVLPATKVMPKEMLPIVDKPAIQYIVEEAAASGIEDILIITNRGKGLLEDHFDRAPELERRLAGDPAKEAILNQVVGISKLANIFYVRQKETKGLGHAIGCAREFVGDEPFAVLYGDDVILGEDPACGQLMRAYEQFGSGVVGVKEVSREAIRKYSSLKVEHIQDNYFRCTDMVEKPQPGQEFSLYSILGRCVLPPEIFDILDNTPPGAGGLMSLFTHTPETIRAGETALRIISAGFLVSAVSVTSSGALEGLGKGVPSLVISLCRYVIVILPAAFLLGKIFGPVGVWNAFWITEAVTAVIAFGVYRSSTRPQN